MCVEKESIGRERERENFHDDFLFFFFVLIFVKIIYSYSVISFLEPCARNLFSLRYDRYEQERIGECDGKNGEKQRTGGGKK